MNGDDDVCSVSVPFVLKRPLIKLCVVLQHPSMAIVKGAGLVMKAIIEVIHVLIPHCHTPHTLYIIYIMFIIILLLL